MSPKSGDEGAEGTGICTFTTMGKTSGKETRGRGERGPRLRKAKEGEGGKHAGLKGPRVEGAGGLCFFETQMYRMENGTLRMGILKTKGLRPLVQNRFPFATKMPIRNIPFSKIRGILELWPVRRVQDKCGSQM